MRIVECNLNMRIYDVNPSISDFLRRESQKGKKRTKLIELVVNLLCLDTKLVIMC